MQSNAVLEQRSPETLTFINQFSKKKKNNSTVKKFCIKTALYNFFFQFTSVQSLSHLGLFATQWTETRQASLSITNYRSLPKLMFIELVMPSNDHILCPLLLPPSIFATIRIFSNESFLPQVAKVLEFHSQHQSQHQSFQ